MLISADHSLNLSPVPFKQVVQFLRSRKAPRFSEIVDYLVGFRQRAAAAKILNELDPEEFERVVNRDPDLPAGDLCEDPIVEACLTAINHVAPLDLDAMAMRFEDGNHIEEMYPASCGYPMGWDEWDELANNQADWNPQIGLFLFMSSLRMGEANALYSASEHYGWDLEIDDIEGAPEPNWERLDNLLDHNGLTCFKNAIAVCLYSTDNPYFDFNPWDEEQLYELPSFTLDGVHALIDFWDEAQPILDDLRAAIDQFSKDRTLAGTLLKLYAQSSPEPQHKPQTLAEIWAGDDDEEDEEDEDDNDD